MKFNIIGRKYDIKENVREYIEKKLSKLDKFFKTEPTARVVLGTIKDNDYIEAQINAGGMIFRAEASDREILAAVDKIIDVIERQIRKNKTKINKRNNSNKFKEFNFDFEIMEEEEEDSKVVKRKHIEMKPMDEEEAILEMELLGHSFFLYKDMYSNDVCVVYKRKDGNYGVISVN